MTKHVTKYGIFYRSKAGDTYARTMNGKWCFAYCGVNDYLWTSYEDKTEAEKAAKLIPADELPPEGLVYVGAYV